MGLDLSSLGDISALIRGQETGNGIRKVKVDAIQPDPNQPRKRFDEVSLVELAQSIESIGMIQPPVVRTQGDGYLLISGERRWRAARQLGWEEVDVIVRDDLNLRAQLVENIQREALSDWEIYRVITGELAAGAKQVDLAKAFGKSKAWVAAYASLAKMPEAFMTLLRENRVSGMTALQSLYRLYEAKPEAAQRLLDAPTLITAVGVARASATAPTSPSMQETMSSQPSHSPAPHRMDRVASAATSPAVSGEVRSFPLPVPNPARVPQVHKVLPIRIRAQYDNENWIVDYTHQRSGVNGTISVRLEGADGTVCFASLEMLKLQSIEVVE